MYFIAFQYFQRFKNICLSAFKYLDILNLKALILTFLKLESIKMGKLEIITASNFECLKFSKALKIIDLFKFTLFSLKFKKFENSLLKYRD